MTDSGHQSEAEGLQPCRMLLGFHLVDAQQGVCFGGAPPTSKSTADPSSSPPCSWSYMQSKRHPTYQKGQLRCRYVERGLEQSWEFTAHETEVGLYPRDLRVSGPSPGLRLGHPD